MAGIKIKGLDKAIRHVLNNAGVLKKGQETISSKKLYNTLTSYVDDSVNSGKSTHALLGGSNDKALFDLINTHEDDVGGDWLKSRNINSHADFVDYQTSNGAAYRTKPYIYEDPKTGKKTKYTNDKAADEARKRYESEIADINKEGKTTNDYYGYDADKAAFDAMYKDSDLTYGEYIRQQEGTIASNRLEERFTGKEPFFTKEQRSENRAFFDRARELKDLQGETIEIDGQRFGGTDLSHLNKQGQKDWDIFNENLASHYDNLRRQEAFYSSRDLENMSDDQFKTLMDKAGIDNNWNPSKMSRQEYIDSQLNTIRENQDKLLNFDTDYVNSVVGDDSAFRLNDRGHVYRRSDRTKAYNSIRNYMEGMSGDEAAAFMDQMAESKNFDVNDFLTNSKGFEGIEINGRGRRKANSAVEDLNYQKYVEENIDNPDAMTRSEWNKSNKFKFNSKTDGIAQGFKAAALSVAGVVAFAGIGTVIGASQDDY